MAQPKMTLAGLFDDRRNDIFGGLVTQLHAQRT